MKFLAENFSTIVISLILLTLIVFAIKSLLKKDGGCHGGCSDCPHRNNCKDK